MIFLVGGCARAGKTSFAVGLGRRLGVVGMIGMDNIRDVIGHDVLRPHGADHDARTERFFPYFTNLVKSLHITHENYVVEGDLVLPRHVAELRQRYPIVPVYFGILDPNVERMIEHAGRLHNWIGGRDPSTYPEILHLVKSRSEYDEAECKRLGIPFFDVSGDDFHRQRDLAEETVVRCAEREALVPRPDPPTEFALA